MANTEIVPNQMAATGHLGDEKQPYRDDQVIVTDESGCVADYAQIQRGYYRSKLFIGSYFAIGLGLCGGISAFGYAAPILNDINADIGPNPNYIWVSYTYSTSLAVCLPIIGRLSDIFGRRYYFIGGSVLAMIGSIVCARAQNIPTLIGGNVFLGVASSTQLSFYIVMGELVPMKHRYLATSALYIFVIPGSGFGPVMAESFIVHFPSVGWRGIYYLLLAINGSAFTCWVLFYHPPTFHMKHGNDKIIEWIKHFDYVGTLLFASGLVLTLIGLSSGGNVYPWKSAPVIVMITLGVCLLVVFVLWEAYAPIQQPLVPLHLFRQRDWIIAVFLSAIASPVYYASALLFPQEVSVLYGNGDKIWVGLMSCVPGLANLIGLLGAGVFANRIGKQKYQCIACFLISGTLVASAATVTPFNKGSQIALVLLGLVFIGWVDNLVLMNTTIFVKNQQEIGTAGGVAGSIRYLFSAIAPVIYVTVLQNRLKSTIPGEVPKAVVAAGLPAGSVEAFIEALELDTPAAFDKVTGLTPKILELGTAAFKQAYADAFHTVWLCSIAFSAMGLIVALFASQAENLTYKVAATLHDEAGNMGITEKSIHDWASEKVDYREVA
ncbi:hypothetical protein CLAIMM_14629 [Cladophialophora immunda]|nr:hypothetical protein CLAIMM_14629 [Cladophialophora immunda]